MASSPEARAFPEFVENSRRLQSAVNDRLTAVEARLCFLTLVREQVARAHHSYGAARKRNRQSSTPYGSVEQKPIQGSRDADPRVKTVFVGNHTLLSCAWDHLLDEALCSSSHSVGTSRLALYDASVWEAVHSTFVSHLGFPVCTAMACFQRFRELRACQLPFDAKEDLALEECASRIGWRWPQLSMATFSYTKRFRTPLDLARRYMVLRPALFWDTYLSQRALWVKVRRRLRSLPFVSVDAVVVSIQLDGQRASRRVSSLPKVSAVKAAIEGGLVDALRRRSTRAYLESLLLFFRDRFDLIGVQLEPLSNDAKSCAMQLSLDDMAVATGCTVADVSRRIKRELLQRTCAPLMVNFEETSRRLFGHTRCTRIIFVEACQLHRQKQSLRATQLPVQTALL